MKNLNLSQSLARGADRGEGCKENLSFPAQLSFAQFVAPTEVRVGRRPKGDGRPHQEQGKAQGKKRNISFSTTGKGVPMKS